MTIPAIIDSGNDKRISYFDEFTTGCLLENAMDMGGHSNLMMNLLNRILTHIPLISLAEKYGIDDEILLEINEHVPFKDFESLPELLHILKVAGLIDNPLGLYAALKGGTCALDYSSDEQIQKLEALLSENLI